MNFETRACQNCKNPFTIEAGDFDFYKKIDVPAPTFCPECRLVRRLTWRNEHSLYKRKCNIPGHGEDIVSVHAPEKKFTVYEHAYWYGDGWDPSDYGSSYDFSKPFFAQFSELMHRTPLVALSDSKSVNSSYCNVTVEMKNCYLVTATWNSEDSYYSNRISYCKDTMDSYICHKTEFGYENVYCKESHRLLFSRNSEGCSDSYFLYDCRNCSDCVCCTNLRNKQYYIFNRPHSKEEYLKKIREMNLGSAKALSELREKFGESCLKAVHKFAQLIKTTNVTGDNVEESKNCHMCFDLAGGAENSKFAHWGTYGLKDTYDGGPGIGGSSELIYEGVSAGVNNARCQFDVIVWYSHDVRYSFNCQDSHDLFGCVGLRNKQYCILNKQYSKESYEDLVPKIIEHMNAMPYVDRKGRIYRFGEFFPPELSPFDYNETVAQDYFPITKEEALEKGYGWREQEAKNYRPTLSGANLPDAIGEVDDGILKETISCIHEGKCNDQCTTAFRIIPEELQFYRRMNLPPPRLCPNCRHYQRLKQRNPLKLWHRQCMCGGQKSESGIYTNTTRHFHDAGKCPNEFETSYTPDRKEIVYCEQCYNAEVV